MKTSPEDLVEFCREAYQKTGLKPRKGITIELGKTCPIGAAVQVLAPDLMTQALFRNAQPAYDFFGEHFGLFGFEVNDIWRSFDTGYAEVGSSPYAAAFAQSRQEILPL